MAATSARRPSAPRPPTFTFGVCVVHQHAHINRQAAWRPESWCGRVDRARGGFRAAGRSTPRQVLVSPPLPREGERRWLYSPRYYCPGGWLVPAFVRIKRRPREPLEQLGNWWTTAASCARSRRSGAWAPPREGRSPKNGSRRSGHGAQIRPPPHPPGWSPTAKLRAAAGLWQSRRNSRRGPAANGHQQRMNFFIGRPSAVAEARGTHQGSGSDRWAGCGDTDAGDGGAERLEAGAARGYGLCVWDLIIASVGSTHVVPRAAPAPTNSGLSVPSRTSENSNKASTARVMPGAARQRFFRAARDKRHHRCP